MDLQSIRFLKNDIPVKHHHKSMFDELNELESEKLNVLKNVV